MEVFRIYDKEREEYVKTSNGKTFWNRSGDAKRSLRYHQTSWRNPKLPEGRYEIHTFPLTTPTKVTPI